MLSAYRSETTAILRKPEQTTKSYISSGDFVQMYDTFWAQMRKILVYCVPANKPHQNERLVRFFYVLFLSDAPLPDHKTKYYEITNEIRNPF